MSKSTRNRPRVVRAEAPPDGAFVPARVNADAPVGATAHPSPGATPVGPASTVPPSGPDWQAIASGVVTALRSDPAPSAPGAPAVAATAPQAAPGAPSPEAGAPGSVASTAPPPAPGGLPDDPASSVHLADVLAGLARVGADARSGSVRVGREPSPYDPETTDGRDRSFFRDVRAASMGDGDARARTVQFTGQLSDYIAAANQDRPGTPEVIPPAWGGEWYVEQIARLRPLVSSFSSASITDPRPIPIPVYKDTAAPGGDLVTEHVEGAPPSSGTVEFETVMVTPKGYSGKVPVTRELLDSASPLVDRAISSALRESYGQATELAFAAVLATITAGVDDAAGTAVGLESATRRALARFPSTRFRTGERIMFSAEHYEVLAGADAADGRPLMPYVGNGPTNAPGTSASAFGTMSVAGVPAVSSWAQAAGRSYVRAADDDALTFESSLLEFQFSEKNGPELVEFAVWGYFAGVIRQPTGVLVVNSVVAPTRSEDDAPGRSGGGSSSTATKGGK